MVEVRTLETASLGDRSYVVTDGDVAAVVDPQRDLDRLEPLLDGLRVTDVFETHLHNDYVTGGHQLARKAGARYHVGADVPVTFERHGLRDGDEIVVGGFAVRAVHTPGHTPAHLAFVVSADGRDRAVFTGGGMLYGAVGRTDLVDAGRTEELTRAQHRSARRLADLLADDVAIHPTHGFGSFCSTGDTSDAAESTMGQERRDNLALRITDEDEFVRELLAGLDDYPAYYAHMAERNRTGPSPVDLSPAPVTEPDDLLRRIDAGEWVVDLRARTAYAAEHVAGTVNIEFEDSSSTYLGWLLPWGSPVTLVGPDADTVAAMQRHLVRIGIDRPAGQRPAGLAGLGEDVPRASYRVADFRALGQALRAHADLVVVDVRQRSEWADGHVVGAAHVPLHELPERIGEIPADHEVWVHCASGFRSSIAASLLLKAGRTPVLIDDLYEHAADHVPLET